MSNIIALNRFNSAVLNANNALETYKLKASFRGCSQADRKKFKRSKCILLINTRQALHEGGKLGAILELINQQFKKCTILIEDTAQRYLFAIYDNKPVDYFFNSCIDEGDRWYHRNTDIIRETLTIPYQVSRWNQWSSHSQFSYYHDKIVTLYADNSEFREAIQLTANTFLKRADELGYLRNREKAIDLYSQYVMEQCIAMCLWAEEGFEFECKTSKRGAALIAAYEKIMKPAQSALKSILILLENCRVEQSVDQIRSYKQIFNSNVFLHAA
jgi:hypothetical protein